MMAPFPPHTLPPPDRDPARAAVRLDVRVGSGRPTSYALEGAEFLVGGATGCDLRLPGSHVPPVICQFNRQGDEVRLRRLATAFPLLLNGAPHTGAAPVLLSPGDRIAIGPADVVVNIHPVGHLHPHFTPTPVAAPNYHRESPPQPTVDSYALQRERAEIDTARARLDEQARELEADRIAWYRRRQEIEEEYRRYQEATAGGQNLALREQALARKEAELLAHERELNGVREELTRIRQTLIDQYHERHDQLAQMQEVVRGASSSFQTRQQQFEADLERRRQQLEDEARRQHDLVEMEVARRVAEVETDFRRRKMELEVQFEERLQQLNTQALTRHQKFEDELSTFQPRMAELSTHRDQLATAMDELESQRKAIADLRQELTRDRQALDAEQQWSNERRQEQDQLLQAREEELARREEQLQDEAQALAEDRRRITSDLGRLERWQASLDERQRELDHRAADIDGRSDQLTRDAQELEQHVQLADAEQQRLNAEADRLDRLKNEVETRAAQAADRAAQLEAQQASLAVLRAKLDRQEQDLDREIAQLAQDRARSDAAQKDLDARLRDAELLRITLSSAQTSTAESRRSIEEQASLLDATTNELRQQKESLTAYEHRLRLKESELDARSTDLAEQTAVLKSKLEQVRELQERLEADRFAVRERESGLSDAEMARVTFQDQLRKRSEELSARSRQLDETAASLADEKLDIERLRKELAEERAKAEQTIESAKQELAQRGEDLARAGQSLADREAALTRQVQRLQDAGRTVSAGRKQLFAMRQAWETERAAFESHRVQVLQELDGLRKQTPEMEEQTAGALAKLTAARDVVRGQIAELHAFAAQTRETLEAVRSDLRAEAERLRERDTLLEKARAEHRLAVAEFRQQLLDWQARVGELKATMTRSEHRIDAKQALLEAASKEADETALELVRRAEQLKIEQERVVERRTEVERHLAEMREWYRAKLRDLAIAPGNGQSIEFPSHPALADLDPGDRQLGELLRSLELVDAETLNGLWNEATRQHRSLRQVLLASGTVTLYQLALIEAGNLDALMMGRFRVVDRVRLTPREAVYRVYDPLRAATPDRGLCVLRMLGDAEMLDAMHPDEYRQRFAVALEAAQPNLTATHEVLEINGRPAVVQEWVSGVPGSEWPMEIAMPGLWIRAMLEVARGVNAAHRVGLIHGRLTTDSVLLTPNGTIKLIGFGDPPWLTSGLAPSFEPTPEADLRAVGQIGFLWLQQGVKKKGRGKGIPEVLHNVVRRLESDAENPMGDTVSGVQPYRSATELVVELEQLGVQYPCGPALWADFVRRASEAPAESPAVKRSA